MPDFSLEQALAAPVAGIDEAGRGPLAGPVVAAAVIFETRRLPQSLRRGIDDSKKLSMARRETLYAELVASPDVLIGVGEASVAEIDSINILRATFLAMQRAVQALVRPPVSALVDGNRAPDLPCSVSTAVKGDGRSLSIAAASIVAKVTRDRQMMALAERHPEYGWQRNMGYGTAEHLAALERLGPTPHHRQSFMPMPLLAMREQR